MQRAVTLREVADRAGVHPSTASRALNPATRDLVNDITTERVMEAAKALGYRPNSLARGLKTNKTFSIGMLLPDLTNPLFPPIVRGVDDTLGSADYTLILGNTDNDLEREAQLISSMMDRRVDGMILATAQRHTQARCFDHPSTGDADRREQASTPSTLAELNALISPTQTTHTTLASREADGALCSSYLGQPCPG